MTTLNPAMLRNLDPPAKGRIIITDTHRDAARGFAVKVLANGSKSFVLRYHSSGRDRLVTIGSWPTWSLTAARKRATELRREIDSGTDILEERRRERAEPSVAEVAEEFLRSKMKLASYADMRGAIHKHLLPELGERKLNEVRRRDVIALIERIAKAHPRQAGVLLAWIKQLFVFAEDREIIEANPVYTLNAQRIGKGLTSTKRTRTLSAEEIRTLMCMEPPNGIHPATLIVLKLILVTGQRPGEIAGMCANEITGDVWTIPAERRGKTCDDHVVPLTATALELLEAARELPSGGEHLFNVRGGPIHRASAGKAVRRFAGAFAMTEPHWRPHDLRRTMRTGLAAAGISETIAELVIGHVRQGIAAVYDQHRYDAEKRSALEAWERRLLHIVAGESPDDNVEVLRARA